MVNLSLERPQYCRGESHSPALCRIHFFIFTLISNNEQFHNRRLWMTMLKITNRTDSSFHSEVKTCYRRTLRTRKKSSLSQLNSERKVKNLYGSLLKYPVILNRRFRNCTPIQLWFVRLR